MGQNIIPNKTSGTAHTPTTRPPINFAGTETERKQWETLWELIQQLIPAAQNNPHTIQLYHKTIQKDLSPYTSLTLTEIEQLYSLQELQEDIRTHTWGLSDPKEAATAYPWLLWHTSILQQCVTHPNQNPLRTVGYQTAIIT